MILKKKKRKKDRENNCRCGYQRDFDKQAIIGKS